MSPQQQINCVKSDREWLVCNGLGGYASGMVRGTNTRSYHGWLIAALHAPLGRTVMWSHLFERLCFANGEASVLAETQTGFRLEDGLPVWEFRAGDVAIERRVFLPHLQNTVVVTYQLIDDSNAVALELQPAFDFRKHGNSVQPNSALGYTCERVAGGIEIRDTENALPPCSLRLLTDRFEFQEKPQSIEDVPYEEERARGYPHRGQLWSPGAFRIDLQPRATVALIGSTEPWPTIDRISPAIALSAEQKRRAQLLEEAGPAAQNQTAARLILAADQFVIRPVGRAEYGALEDAKEITARTVIAGYHWFTDWGRDTMISLEGLTLTTGRFAEARQILLTFSSYLRDGLIPNLFPDGENEGLYHTADATLWFFHALSRYLEHTGDAVLLSLLLPALTQIADAHLRGTKFNIHVDPADGLLVQGEDGYQLTWMDAKVDGWVVTPRRGKAVEINALWFNALKLLEGWLREAGESESADCYAEHAARAYDSFNQRFWFEEGACLHDLIDSLGDGSSDPACRPNQILAVSLDRPVLEQKRWPAVLEVVKRELLTPYGLRSLSPKHPDYKPNYHGDLRTRDAAYHQGTVWAWLIGPFIDAWLKVHPQERAAARGFLARFPKHLGEAGLGSISEVFDAREPHLARGCIAQAWSVAEVLRCWVKTAGTVR